MEPTQEEDLTPIFWQTHCICDSCQKITVKIPGPWNRSSLTTQECDDCFGTVLVTGEIYI